LNFGIFENLVASYYHLSADPTLTAQMGLSYSPVFVFSNGTTGFVTSSVNGGIFGMAVRSGEVSTVPEPATMLLLASVSLGAVVCARKKK
jgi:hypothetical protein